MCSTLRGSCWPVEALKYLGQRQGGETWNGHRMADAQRAWYGNSAHDIPVLGTEISTRNFKLQLQSSIPECNLCEIPTEESKVAGG